MKTFHTVYYENGDIAAVLADYLEANRLAETLNGHFNSEDLFESLEEFLAYKESKGYDYYDEGE